MRCPPPVASHGDTEHLCWKGEFRRKNGRMKRGVHTPWECYYQLGVCPKYRKIEEFAKLQERKNYLDAQNQDFVLKNSDLI